MREISINLGPSIEQGDLEIVRAAASHLKPGDHLTLSLEAADAHETDRLLALLADANLDCQTHGSHSGQTFFIIATPRGREAR